MREIYLGLGSNVDREKNLAGAVRALRENFGEVQLSPVYESESFGFSGDNFFNLVVRIETELDLQSLDQLLKKIEDAHGRVRGGEKFSDRTLDIDILTCDELGGKVEGIDLPRDEIFKCAFVLKPFQDIAPEKVLPGQDKSLAGLWQDFDQSSQQLAVIKLEL